MSPSRKRKASLPEEPTSADQIVEILSALEYGTKKEEKELIDKTFGQFSIERRAKKEDVAPAIAQSPGFEPFFLAVVDEVKPFAQMLAEIYAFLGRRATVGRRASTFRVTTADAEAVFDFSLAAFPKHLVKLLMTGLVEQATMALILPEVTTRRAHPLVKQWEAISSNWDNDFYDTRDIDTRFFMLASYASLMRSRMSAGDWSRIEAAVEPVMDRLAALLEAFTAAGVPLKLPTQMPLLSGELELQLHAAQAHAAQPPTLDQLGTPALPYHRERTFTDLFRDLSDGWAVAVHLWRSPTRVRRDDHLKSELGPVSDPARYRDTLIRAAQAFTKRLDEVAPIVERQSQELTVESFKEFTDLPFWKHRWFLYELWTLVRALDIAARAGTITLEGLKQPSPGVQQWVLPGGTASAPVARIANSTRSVSVWTQLKSQHPQTDAGLEPDLRIRQDRKPQADLFLIENKDRLTITTKKLAEIASRYVTGTKVHGAWFVNYETFPTSAHGIEADYPDRGVRVVSKFRPDSVPADFETSLLAALRSELESAVADAYIAVTLEWTSPPDDLDLYASLERGGVRTQVFYNARGSLTGPPYAELNVDERKGGAERLVVAIHDLDLLTIAVHRYSPGGSFKSARATITVEALDAQQHMTRVIATRTVTHESPAEWWLVLEMDADEIYWNDTFSVKPPLPL